MEVWLAVQHVQNIKTAHGSLIQACGYNITLIIQESPRKPHNSLFHGKMHSHAKSKARRFSSQWADI